MFTNLINVEYMKISFISINSHVYIVFHIPNIN